MLLHILKIIWNRKRANSLIILEIAIAFMVVFAIALMLIANYKLYVQPLGFEYRSMWNISFSSISGPWEQQRDQPQLQQLVNQLKQQPEIEKVQLLQNPTFRRWSSSSSYEINGRNIRFFRNYMDDGAPQTFGLKLLKGRWFGVQDKGQDYVPVVVNLRFVEEFFKNEDPIGQNITRNETEEDKSLPEQRVIGVYEDFRQQGELNELTPYVIYRYDITDGGQIHNIELKMAPGTTIAYEEKLMQLLNDLAPNWEFKVMPWEKLREFALREVLIPLALASIIGVFLIIMVAMGLFGVLWQNITSRTQEIGIRRALGATAVGIHWQVITELVIVCCLGMAISLALLIQLPILGVFPELTWSLFWSAQIVAIMFMLLLSVTCAYYPGKLATAFSPAEALHYE